MQKFVVKYSDFANLIGLCFPFAQRLDCKIGFVFHPADGGIGQFADVEEQKIEVEHF